MEVTVQCQFVAASDPAGQQTSKRRIRGQVIMFVEIRHHQPSDRHLTQRVDGFDEGLVIGPGLRRNVV